MQRSHGCQLGHHLAAGHLDLLVIDFGRQFQRAHVVALVIDLIQVVIGRCKGQPQVVTALVGKGHHGVHGQSAQLRQQHARQCHTVVHLGQIDAGLVELHVHGELVGAGGDTLADHRLDVIVQFLDQAHVALGKLLLGAQRHDLPVGGVNIINHVLDLALAHLLGELLGEFGNLVHRGNLAAHVDGLRHRQGSAHQVVDVVGEAALGQQCHRRGDKLPVDLHGGSRAGIHEQVVVILSRLGVERLGGQHLVLLDERHLAGIVDVTRGEVKLRQVGSGCLLALVTGLLDGECRLLNFLVITQRHVAA